MDSFQQMVDNTLNELMAKKKFAEGETEIVHKGTQIILPDDPRQMTEAEAIDQLKRKMKQSEMTVSIFEEIDCFPLEGAYALMKVLEQTYGWVNSVPREGFFGSQPPVMVTLEVGHRDYRQVIWGNFEIPGIEGVLSTNQSHKNDTPIFVMSGQVKKKYQGEVQSLANKIREYVRKNSLYKGKAIKLITDGKNNSDINLNSPPQFLDLSRVNEDELVFSKDVEHLVQTNVFAPIEKTELCRKYGVPLKRGVLLEGPYGTGKTLTAFVSAKKAVANKWTFIYLDRVTAIKEALIFARRYAPAVIFAEDIERIVTGGRTTSVDDVLNTIDGIDSKNQELLCIFTTNHVDQINKAMLRPGRLDAVITVNPPDAEAAQKLIRVYAKGLIAENESLEQSGAELNGQIPATIREVVERSKLFAIHRLNEGEELKLTDEDIRRSAVGMKGHLAILNPKEKVITPQEVFYNSFKEMVSDASIETDEFTLVKKQVTEIHNDLLN